MKGRNGGLDFLKTAAAVCLVFHHYQQMAGVRFGTFDFFDGSIPFYLLTELFFVMSGFFAEYYSRFGTETDPFWKYYFSKACRILPAAACSTVVYTALSWVYSRVFHVDAFGVPTSIWSMIVTCLGIQDSWCFTVRAMNPPLWYLPALMLCYILFYFAAHSKNKSLFFAAFVLLGCGIKDYGIHLPCFNGASARGYAAFFTGAILARLVKKGWIDVESRRTALFSMGIAAVLGYMIVTGRSMAMEGQSYLLTFFVYPALVLLCLHPVVQTVFSHPVWGFLGKVSFDLYVWHCPVILAMLIVKELVVSIPTEHPMTMVAMLFITLPVAIASYFLIEKPAAMWGREKISQMEQEQPVL